MTAARFSVSRETTLRARALRHEATPFEKALWARINRGQLEGARFRRQHPVGPYILDFYCAALKLCVELDGHSHGIDGAAAHDRRRSAYLAERGIAVLRFWNDAVKENVVGVAEEILLECRRLREAKR